MKDKILLITVLIISFVLVGNIYAVNQDSGSGTGSQVQQQTQTVNQGEDSQIQIQNNEQVQSGNVINQTGPSVGDRVQQQTQTQQGLQDGNEAGSQVQNQNQIKNQGEANQIQNNEEEGIQKQEKGGSAAAVQRRSRVANTVQEMLQVADRSGEIGQQVRIIAQTQTQNQERLEASLQKVQSRSEFAKFFIGPNYREINNAKETLAQNREQIERLNQVKNQLINQDDQQNLTQQVQILEQANLEIENSLDVSQEGFSLFGWIFRLFAK